MVRDKKMEEPRAKILLVEDDEGQGDLLSEELADIDVDVRRAWTAEEASDEAARWHPDLIISDLRLPGADGLTLLRQVRSAGAGNPPDFIMITAFGSVHKAVESLQAGAEDFLTKPVDLDHFRLSVRRILEKRMLREEVLRIRAMVDEERSFHGMIGASQGMTTLFRQIQQVARADGPVLILGESGTGKELVARAVHAESRFRDGPFLAVNCAGIPEALLESEFFGHEEGAFTGAGRMRRGLFAEAEGGTLLLDEISEMPLPLQAKLLRMLQDGKIRPVGSDRERQVDVRIVAATHCDLEERTRDGKFREDLFYRLETFPLHLPPLRERGEDLDLLAGFFLARQTAGNASRIEGFSMAALERLHRYPFPGNVRELRNAVERAVVYCRDRQIGPEHLPPRIREPARAADGILSRLTRLDGDSLPTLEEMERRYIRHVVEQAGGNKRLAASILGIARRTLYRRLEE